MILTVQTSAYFVLRMIIFSIYLKQLHMYVISKYHINLTLLIFFFVSQRSHIPVSLLDVIERNGSSVAEQNSSEPPPPGVKVMCAYFISSEVIFIGI